MIDSLHPAFLDAQSDEKAAWWAPQQNKEAPAPHPPLPATCQCLVTAQERPLAHQRWGTAGLHPTKLPLFKSAFVPDSLLLPHSFPRQVCGHWTAADRKAAPTLSHCAACSLRRVRLPAPPRTVARQPPLPTGFSRQEHWSGGPFPPPGRLLDPGIEPMSPVSPALQAILYHLSHKNQILCFTGPHNLLLPHRAVFFLSAPVF